MDKIILSQIPVEDLAELVKKAVREEIVNIQAPGNETITKPVTQTELCQFLGVTEPTILRMRKKGKIPFFLVGSAVRFNISSVMKALENTKYNKSKRN